MVLINMLRYLLILNVFCTLAQAGPPTVRFNTNGFALRNGKPFFPIGLFTYSLDEKVISETHRLHFNTVTLLTEHHKPSLLDRVHKEKLMAVCPPGDDWVAVGTNHPAVLAWYLADEPEGHGFTPEGLKQKYQHLQALDPAHPVGLDHFLYEALEKFKDACDFTMTSVYPISLAPITHVGLFMDRARAIHGTNWPHWPYIQIFGGPNTDGGKWKQPEPGEVRCMVYNALIHRANGMFYFSYWPQAPATWESVGVLNQEIEAIAPLLLAPGREIEARSSLPEVQVRARELQGRKGGLVLLQNTVPEDRSVTIEIPQLPEKELRSLFEKHRFKPTKRTFTEKLGPYATRAYRW